MLDAVINALRAPIDFVRSKVFGVQNVKGSIKMDISRVKQVGGEYKDAGKAVVQKGKPGNKGKAKKMGLFSKKKQCPSCGEKLHASWDQCPYCGWSEGAPAPAASAGGPVKAAAPSAPMRTMAIDGGGPAPSGNGIGWLVPLDGPQTGELFQLKGRAIVGTAADCDAVMKDPSISGRHAEFTATSGGFRVTDLSSTNGTYVNDKRVTTTDLIDNDSIRLGRINFKFKSMS
jgi:hypothetical protein